MKPIVNWQGFDQKNPAHVQRVVAQIQEFFHARAQGPDEAMRRVQAKIQEFTSAKDTAAWQSTIPMIANAIQEDVQANADIGWKLAFDEIDLRQTPTNNFNIPGVSSGLTFSKVLPGERIQIYGVSGTNVNVPIDTYGGGIGYLRQWWRDQQYYRIDQQTRDFNFKYEKERRDTHMALITAITDAISYTVDEATTINNACAELIVDNDGALPINDGTAFLFYHNPAMKGRVFKGLTAVTSTLNQRLLQYNVTPVSTIGASASYLGWLVAPGIKNQHGRRQDLEIETDTDITMLAENIVGSCRYGSYINAAQVRRLAAS